MGKVAITRGIEALIHIKKSHIKKKKKKVAALWKTENEINRGGKETKRWKK